MRFRFRFQFHQLVVFVMVLLVLLQGKSLSHARLVKKLSTVDAAEKVVAVERVKKLSLQKEIVPTSTKRKDDEKKKWKENLVAFSADYRWPKPHPPKNN